MRVTGDDDFRDGGVLLLASVRIGRARVPAVEPVVDVVERDGTVRVTVTVPSRDLEVAWNLEPGRTVRTAVTRRDEKSDGNGTQSVFQQPANEKVFNFRHRFTKLLSPIFSIS